MMHKLKRAVDYKMIHKLKRIVSYRRVLRYKRGNVMKVRQTQWLKEQTTIYKT
jgi:hypothetical protein